MHQHVVSFAKLPFNSTFLCRNVLVCDICQAQSVFQVTFTTPTHRLSCRQLSQQLLQLCCATTLLRRKIWQQWLQHFLNGRLSRLCQTVCAPYASGEMMWHDMEMKVLPAGPPPWALLIAAVC